MYYFYLFFVDFFLITIPFEKWIEFFPHIQAWLNYEHRHYISGKNKKQVEMATQRRIASHNLKYYV